MSVSLPTLKTKTIHTIEEPNFIEVEGARVHNLKNIDKNNIRTNIQDLIYKSIGVDSLPVN